MLDKAGNMLVDQSVVVAVKIIGADQVGNTLPRLIFKQQTAQNRLLGFNGMGREFEKFQGIVSHAEL
jgi:hypothetical protein